MSTLQIGEPVPAWNVSQWFNTDDDPQLSDFRGRVVVVEAFQMLCPGCVIDGLPLAQRIYRAFSQADVAVVGLHTVFEHHEVMQPAALKAFLAEYCIGFPVGVDQPSAGGLPETMTRYGLRGTPSLMIINREGKLSAYHFGAVDDLRIGAAIGALVNNGGADPMTEDAGVDQVCGLNGCS